MKRKHAEKLKTQVLKRSSCPLACSLDIIGDRWTLLILRDLFLGRSRFKELALSPERPPTNILSERLERLLFYRIIEKTDSSDGSKHRAYKLTEKGRSLRVILESIRDWGLNWIPGTEIKIKAK